MIQIVTNVLGTFALKNGKVIEKILFERDPVKIAGKMLEAENNVIDEEASLIRKLNVDELEVENPEKFMGKFDIKFKEGEFISVEHIADEIGINRKELNRLLFEVNLELTKAKMRMPERDQMAIQAIKTIDEIDNIINQLVESLREWYSLHFPEINSIIKNHEIYAKLVSLGPSRSKLAYTISKIINKRNIEKKEGKNLNLTEDTLKKIIEASKKSFGQEFSESDLSGITELSNQVTQMYETRKKLEKYVEKIMHEIMPNSTALAGALLSARILAIAGSMQRLAEMPASTIQMLGAETALFRFLKTKNKPPKHGVIFTLPEIANSKKSNRGKIARAFASKFSIAVKVDVYKGEFIGDRLREEFLERVKKLNV